GGAPGRGAAHLPRNRPRLLPPAAGGRPPRVLTPAAQPLRRRGARHRARVAVRRRLERRAGAASARRAQAAAFRRARERVSRGPLASRCAAVPGVQAALRPARRAGLVTDARTAVRADRLRTRLRPRGARAVARAAPLREPAEAWAARARVRGAARA